MLLPVVIVDGVVVFCAVIWDDDDDVLVLKDWLSAVALAEPPVWVLVELEEAPTS